MSITYAGVPLILEDVGHEFQTWLDKTLSLEDLNLWSEQSASQLQGLWNPVSKASPRLGLPNVNWPKPPRMKLNTVWWPTGATRWARGLFLCNQNQLARIWRTLGGTTSGNSPYGGSPHYGELIFKEEGTSTRQISFTMYLLPPRAVTNCPDCTDAWLLPLVDERYFWQFRNVGDISAVTSWSDLISSIASALGCSLANEITSNVGPDPAEMCRSYANAACLLDAAAYTLGGRLVYDGGYRIQSADSAVSALNGQQPQVASSPVLAGGGWSKMQANAIPKTIRVCFPTCVNHRRIGDGDEALYAVDVAASDILDDGDGRQIDGSTVTITDTARANFLGCICKNIADTSADNDAEIQGLAGQIAKNYLAWIGDVYDVSFVGLNSDWQGTGFDDYLWFHFGYQYPLAHRLDGDELERPIVGDYAAFTRVCSLPHNVGLTTLFHQFNDVDLESSEVEEDHFVNESCEKAPAYACLAVADIGFCQNQGESSSSGECDTEFAPTIAGKLVISAWKPDCDLFARDYVVNKFMDVEAGQTGPCWTTGIVPILYEVDSNGNAPEYGDELGPVLGQWYVQAGQPAIATCIGILDSSRKIALVRLHPMLFASLVVGYADSNYAETACTLTLTNLKILEPLGMASNAIATIPGVEADGTLIVQNFLQREISQGTQILARLAWDNP